MKPTKPHSLGELEYRLLYSMVVAGKSADFAEKKMHAFLIRHPDELSPLRFVRELIKRGGLEMRLRLCKTGNYSKLAKGFSEVALARFDLRTVKAPALQEIHGIGPKTARFFLMWTRPETQHAALDTHVLKWLQMLGYPDIPRSSPSGQTYARIEKIFLSESKMRGVTPVDLDSQIWRYCRDARIGWTKHMDPYNWPPALWSIDALNRGGLVTP